MTVPTDIATQAAPIIRDRWMASSDVIQQNIRRLYGTMAECERQTQIPRGKWYAMIKAGEISEFYAGRLFALRINPDEFLRPANPRQLALMVIRDGRKLTDEERQQVIDYLQ